MKRHWSPDWRQPFRQWCSVLSHFITCWRPQKHPSQAHEPIWSSPSFISGGPVHTIKNDDDAITIIVALPGLAPTDIKLALEKNRLLIQGQTKRALESEDHIPSYAERNARIRVRSAILPCMVDIEQATITRQNGLLHIVLPKRTNGTVGHVSGVYKAQPA